MNLELLAGVRGDLLYMTLKSQGDLHMVWEWKKDQPTFDWDRLHAAAMARSVFTAMVELNCKYSITVISDVCVFRYESETGYGRVLNVITALTGNCIAAFWKLKLLMEPELLPNADNQSD